MSVRGELAQALAELEMVSHVSAVNLEPQIQTGEGNDRGGRCPSGGVSGMDDRERGDDAVDDRPAVLRSHLHYRRRADRCVTDADRARLLGEVQATIGAWKRAPRPTDPPWTDISAWKFWAARSPLPVAEMARLAGVSRQAVYQRMRGYPEFDKRRRAA